MEGVLVGGVLLERVLVGGVLTGGASLENGRCLSLGGGFVPAEMEPQIQHDIRTTSYAALPTPTYESVSYINYMWG